MGTNNSSDSDWEFDAKDALRCIETGERMKRYARDPYYRASPRERAEIEHHYSLLAIEWGSDGFRIESTGKRERVWSRSQRTWYEREKVKIYDTNGRRISLGRTLKQTEPLENMIADVVPVVDSFNIYKPPKP